MEIERAIRGLKIYGGSFAKSLGYLLEAIVKNDSYRAVDDARRQLELTADYKNRIKLNKWDGSLENLIILFEEEIKIHHNLTQEQV